MLHMRLCEPDGGFHALKTHRFRAPFIFVYVLAQLAPLPETVKIFSYIKLSTEYMILDVSSLTLLISIPHNMKINIHCG